MRNLQSYVYADIGRDVYIHWHIRIDVVSAENPVKQDYMADLADRLSS